jgi:hypothetical protein
MDVAESERGQTSGTDSAYTCWDRNAVTSAVKRNFVGPGFERETSWIRSGSAAYYYLDDRL